MSEFDIDDLLDEEPSEEELREAMELARALDRGTADDAPEDALGVAALLRHAQDGSELDPERAQALFEELMRDARPPTPVKKASPSWLRWLVPAGVFAAAAVALLLFLRPVANVQAA
ncbi:MAG: hypothetical protein GW913_03530, partial [Myxococcales bacterium]|nr:hypothetical protein [Myxococcales bacterium]